MRKQGLSPRMLVACAVTVRSDGYWLFQFTDFPAAWDPASPPKLNGTPDEYWTAIAAANNLLDDAAR